LEACHRPALIEGQKENKKDGEIKLNHKFAVFYVTMISIALAASLYANSFVTLQPDFILEWSSDEQVIVNGTLRIELTFEWRNESLNIIAKINDDEYHAGDLLGFAFDIDGHGWIDCFAACNLTTEERLIMLRWNSYYNAYTIGDILKTDGYFIRDPYSNCTFTEGVGYTYNITIPKTALSKVKVYDAIVAFRDATERSKTLEWWVSAEIEGWQ